MNIKDADKTKRRVEKILWLLHKVIASRGEIHAIVSNAGNPIVKTIYDIATEANSHVPDSHIRQSFQDVFEFFLYIYYRDSAYRDQGDYILKEFLMKAHELLPLLNPKPPDEWYVSEWIQSKKDTEELREMGVLSDEELSATEAVFSDGNQLKRFQKWLFGRGE